MTILRAFDSATLFGLAAVLLWSTVATAFKLTLRHLDPAPLLLWASVFSALALAAVLAAQGRLGLLLRGSRRQYLLSAVLGLMNPCVYYLVLFEAYDRLPAQEAQPLNFTWALVLAFLSILILKQRIGWRDIGAGLVCYGGVWIISTHGRPLDVHFSDGLGVALALGSTLIWALYWVLNTRDARDPVAGLLLAFLFGLPWVAGWTLLTADPSPGGWPGLLGAAYVGCFEMGFTFVLWLTALRRSANASRVANLIFLAPFLSLLLIHHVLDERVLPSTFAGLVLIVAGLIWQRTGGRAAAVEEA